MKRLFFAYIAWRYGSATTPRLKPPLGSSPFDDIGLTRRLLRWLWYAARCLLWRVEEIIYLKLK